jgi:hypothetical protein
MTTLTVENLKFTFYPEIVAEKYDVWQYHRNISQHNKKAVDIVAVKSDSEIVWLLEVKDFRIISNPPRSSNLHSLPETVAKKFFDTLDGLKDAAENAVEIREKNHASLSAKAKTKRLVLHLEPHPPTGNYSVLFRRNYAARVLQKLKTLVAAIDVAPRILNISNTNSPGFEVPWDVA